MAVRVIVRKIITVAARLFGEHFSQPRGSADSWSAGKPPPPGHVPDTRPARRALHQALALLDTPNDPAALTRARQAAWHAFHLVPYPWQAPDCENTRRGWGTPTCLDQGCTRCATYEAGYPLSETGPSSAPRPVSGRLAPTSPGGPRRSPRPTADEHMEDA